MAAEDFNPDFSFDFGAEIVTQAPWEFGGALKQALRDNKQPASTIDDKINKRLQLRSSQAGKQKQPASRKRPAPDSDSEEEDEGGLSSDDEDSDEPLPGEDLGSDDDGDEGASEDSDTDMVTADLDGAGDSDKEAEGDSDREQGAQQQQQTKAAKQQQQQQGKAAKQQQQQQQTKAAKQQQQQQTKASKQQQQQQQQEDEDAAGSSDDDSDADEQQQDPRTSARARQQPASTSGRQQGGSFYAETPEGTRFSAANFADLNLSRPLLRAVSVLGYTLPTPIQAACIPLALTGRDICGSAVTGSGKTAAFSLPILERLLHRPKQVAATYVLIISPTRELAVQIHSMIGKLAQFTDISCALIVGGLSLQAQAAALRKGPEIVVATPGRIIDHLRNTQSFGLEDLSVLVLDEADRLLEMGFKEELAEIIKQAPRKRQTMLFSATFNSQVQALMSLSLKSPVRLAADAAAAVPKTLVQEIVRLKGGQAALKEAMLLTLCSRSFAGGRTIVFFKTKQKAHRAKILFGLCKLPPAGELHGDMTQAARLESLERFRKGELSFLLATDVAARGLDIQGVQVVVNFDAPRTLETYLHRIGRTARAGSSGAAVTFLEDGDRQLLKEVVKKGKVVLKQRLLPQQAVAQWQAKVETSQPDVIRIHAEERQEKELRKAEMEATKVQNMLDHEAEIYSRPARTWFQSEREKKKSASAAKAVEVEGQAVQDAPKQNKAQKNAKAKLQREEAATKKKVPALAAETEAFSKNIKSIKSRTRELVQQQGISPHQAAKIAAAAVTGKSTKHQKKKRKVDGGGLADDSGGLFAGDGLGGKQGAGAGAGAARGSSSRPGKGGDRGTLKSALSHQDLNKLKRGGKGRKAFKSRKKHKRR